MTRLKFDREPFLLVNTVQQGTSRTLYSRLLAYQHSLSTIRFYRRRHSITGNYVLPASSFKRFSPFGSLRLVDGHPMIKASIISILQQQGIQCSELHSDSTSAQTANSHEHDDRNNNNCTHSTRPINIYYT
eukprot:6186734-Pleurochrysis_carterae.AAC.2